MTSPLNNDTGAPAPAGAASQGPGAGLVWLGRILRFLLVLAFLGAGGGIGAYWMMNRPVAPRRAPQRQAVLVEAMPVSMAPERIVIRAQGTVVPARTVQLSARVPGQIIAISPEFVPGGRFAAGQRILQIDPRDYELAVRQREGDLARTQLDLKVEMGQQSVAKREYELLGKDVEEDDMELLLRKPQLAAAQAAVESAQAALEKARLDLKRTDVTAPFNAVVSNREIELGSQVAAGAPLAELVGTDEYWLQISVPVDQLRWIRIPGLGADEGSTVRVYHEASWGPGVFRQGRVERLMSELESQGRMARLLAAVKDPLEIKSDTPIRRPLILNSYFRVEIDGLELPKAVRLPRIALRDGSNVWVMKPDGTLEIRAAAVAWGAQENVLITGGLSEGDMVVTSDLGSPVPGMALRTAETSTQASQPAKEPQQGARPEARRD